jgi:hypothetical protein
MMIINTVLTILMPMLVMVISMVCEGEERPDRIATGASR